MSDIKRAIEKQAKLEAEASPTPWRAGKEYVDTPLERIDCFSITGHSGFNAEFIAHLRNQAKLARDVIEAGHKLSRWLPCGPAVSADEIADWAEHDAALAAWADHVNGEKP